MEISVGRSLFETNDQRAEELARIFKNNNVLVLNLISSPGAGKTSLLERTLRDLAPELKMAVIEGDLQTDNDAQRVAATGAKAVQINTNGGCHLDAKLVMDVLPEFDLPSIDILFIENVGNLVCPVEFNCGEDHKIALLSVTEGDDKPEKYPLLFNLSSVMLLNKVDLLPYVDFDVDRASSFARATNQNLTIFPVACRGEGQGLEAWYDWLRAKVREKRA